MGDIQRCDRGAVRGECKGEITGAGREVQRSSARAGRREVYRSTLPPAVQPERQQDSDEVVTIRDGREQATRVALFGLRRGEGPVERLGAAGH